MAAESISDLPTSDASPTPLGLRVGFVEPIELALHPASNTVHAKATLRVELQWQDERLLTTPCRQIWASQISTSSSAAPRDQTDAASFSAYFWTPALKFANEIAQTSTQSIYNLSTSSTLWLQADAPVHSAAPLVPGAALCGRWSGAVEGREAWREECCEGGREEWREEGREPRVQTRPLRDVPSLLSGAHASSSPRLPNKEGGI